MAEGLVDVNAITDVQARITIGEVIGLAAREYNLRKACQVVPVRKLVGNTWVAEDLAGQRKVRELENAQLKKVKWSKLDWDLWKNVVHIAVSDEAQLKSDVDQMTVNVNSSANAMSAMENQDIGDVLATISGTTSGADWGVDTNDPWKQITKAGAEIKSEKKGYRPNSVLMSDNLYGEFVGNKNISDRLERGWIKDGELSRIGKYSILSDPDLPDDEAYVLASAAPAILLGWGPTMAEKYRDTDHGFNAYKIVQWLEPQLALDAAGRRITGL